MKPVCLLPLALLLLGATTASADDLPQPSFGPFPLPLKRVYVRTSQGSPGTKDGLHGPFPDDSPPQVVVALEDARHRPSYQGRYGYFSYNAVRVYNITNLPKSPYKTIRSDVEKLRRLLQTRPTGTPKPGYPTGKIFAQFEDLPDYPPRNAGHMLQSKVQFVDFAWGSGVFYITQFVQGVGEFPDNDSLIYLFQGLSKDGNHYVSAEFRITHPALAKPVPKVKGKYRDSDVFTENIEVRFPQESDDAFTPSLRKLREFMGTWEMEPANDR